MKNKEKFMCDILHRKTPENPRVPEFKLTKEQEDNIKEFQRSYLMKRREEFRINYEVNFLGICTHVGVYSLEGTRVQFLYELESVLSLALV